MKMPSIPENFLKSIFQQAEQEYPEECCGLILGNCGRENFSRIKAVKNAQEKYHTQDPVQFPRSARQAYFMEPKELLLLQKELRGAKEEIRVIYHSHIEAGAYFSEEDKRIALFEGEPVYPGVDYLIVSVMQGKAKEACFYRWSPEKKEFIDLGLEGWSSSSPT